MANCITVSDLAMRFPGCDALRQVNLNVPTGSVFALLGENGAGKTTLIRILMGFLKPTRGACTVCQRDPGREALEIRRRVGYVSDTPSLYSWMSVEQTGWFTSAFYDDLFLDRYRELTSRYDLPVSRKIRHLSNGATSQSCPRVGAGQKAKIHARRGGSSSIAAAVLAAIWKRKG